MFKIGDYVTRKKYGNDIVFKITKIDNKKIYLKGVDLRLYADANIEDLVACEKCKKKEKYNLIRNLDINEYFYVPGVILHLDTDEDYLERCLDYYKKQKVKAYGYVFNVKDFKYNVLKLIEKHNPAILVLTGHDAYYKETKKYKNSIYYIEAVKEVRKKIINHDDLIIISGACQSDYEKLILAKSTYASSPKHINIHALDPAIIATSLALITNTETANIIEILNKTNYGSDGFGGIITYGTMFKGFPRKEEN
jgi:spore coat assembly protein